MMRRIRQLTRPVAGVLVLALAVVLSAECLVGEEMTAAEHACCASMADTCESMGAEHDCCTPDNDATPQLTSVKILIPTADIAPVVMAAAPPSFPLRNRRATRVSLAYAYVPSYLLGSAFLI
ncbi:MAG: hypothetical protein K2Y23_24880 [Cyanobacteria bacterium]|nr:hypothetical protein [Cyanobacteriota bacterium]